MERYDLLRTSVARLARACGMLNLEYPALWFSDHCSYEEAVARLGTMYMGVSILRAPPDRKELPRPIDDAFVDQEIGGSDV